MATIGEILESLFIGSGPSKRRIEKQEVQALRRSEAEKELRGGLEREAAASILAGNQPQVPGVASSLLGGQQFSTPLSGLTGDPAQDAEITKDVLQQFVLNRDIQSSPDVQTMQGLHAINQLGLSGRALSRPDATVEDALNRISRRADASFKVQLSNQGQGEEQGLDIQRKKLDISALQRKEALAEDELLPNIINLPDGDVQVRRTKRRGKPTNKDIRDAIDSYQELHGIDSMISFGGVSLTPFGKRIAKDTRQFMRDNSNITTDDALEAAVKRDVARQRSQLQRQSKVQREDELRRQETGLKSDVEKALKLIADGLLDPKMAIARLVAQYNITQKEAKSLLGL